MKPKIVRALNKSLVITLIITAFSFIIPIVPCKTARWGACKLPNPFTQPIANVSQRFFGSLEPIGGLVLQFLLILAIVTIILLTVRKKVGKILDLTNKR